MHIVVCVGWGEVKHKKEEVTEGGEVLYKE